MSEHDISPPFRIAVNSTGLHCNGWQSAEVKPGEATKHVGPVGRALAKLVSDYFCFQSDWGFATNQANMVMHALFLWGNPMVLGGDPFRKTTPGENGEETHVVQSVKRS